MDNLISNLASWSTLILFAFYFIGRIITILTVKKLWKEKVVPADKISDEYGIVDVIYDENKDISNNNEFASFLISREGMKNIKVYRVDVSDFANKIKKGELIYKRSFLNINEALQINIEKGELFPTLFIEYETMDYMKVELKWYDNLKNGVYSEMVVPRNTLKSVIYQLLK